VKRVAAAAASAALTVGLLGLPAATQHSTAAAGVCHTKTVTARHWTVGTGGQARVTKCKYTNGTRYYARLTYVTPASRCFVVWNRSGLGCVKHGKRFYNHY
jgi:hypothetical protein